MIVIERKQCREVLIFVTEADVIKEVINNKTDKNI